MTPISAARPISVAEGGRSWTGTMVTDPIAPAAPSRTGRGAGRRGDSDATRNPARSHRSHHMGRRLGIGPGPRASEKTGRASEKPAQIGADALEHRGIRLGNGKALAGD